MKVKMMENYRNVMTINEAEQAKAVINYCKSDPSTIEDYAKCAISEALKDKDYCMKEVIKATAETAFNVRVWDAYGDTGRIDVWIEAVAETFDDGFIRVCAFLTDIWRTGEDGFDCRKHIGFGKYKREA